MKCSDFMLNLYTIPTMSAFLLWVCSFSRGKIKINTVLLPFVFFSNLFRFDVMGYNNLEQYK